MMTWLYNLLAVFGVELIEVEASKILHVIDGDTIYVSLDGSGGELKVRISGIDAPEIDGACDAERQMARRARSHLQSLLPIGTTALLLPKGVLAWEYDKYGRLISYVENHKGINVASALVDFGVAKKWKKEQPKPNWCGGVQ